MASSDADAVPPQGLRHNTSSASSGKKQGTIFEDIVSALVEDSFQAQYRKVGLEECLPRDCRMGGCGLSWLAERVQHQALNAVESVLWCMPAYSASLGGHLLVFSSHQNANIILFETS